MWRIELAKHGWTASTVSAALHATPADGLALLSTSDTTGVLIDLGAGIVVSETAQDEAVDSSAGILVIFDEAGLYAYDPDDQPLWSLSVEDQISIEALGGVVLHLREDGSIRVHNVLTGESPRVWWRL
ncbi:hypothetical protein [Brachybacterium saurashtrense]|uniref:Uncharacterized protein n=1 Tax=Brachybacterium saurashtrense TaxID=556288 RepID=A0A345YLR3_9MICO|nr:hypothetical protein [Brachybacterium saurashtrense]AXK44865.1 hypothetical protein DWV08_03965 [Brachybacterium saurashtrense]RRR20726.1 hypothetical protein DXU92_17105 [Brachybacterium saurashtrense]